MSLFLLFEFIDCDIETIRYLKLYNNILLYSFKEKHI